MTSRLDRLFVLLESGSGPARSAAARQLGEVQKARPEELQRLLSRLMRYLRSPAWDTRLAAAQAVEAILKNVPTWVPPPCEVKTEEEPEPTPRLSCKTFDLEKVLEKGAHLMACEGTEFDMDDEGLTPAELKERLAKQHQQLNSRLGLDVAVTLGVDIGSVYTNEDLCPTRHSEVTVKPKDERMPVEELMSLPGKAMSSREINLAKRKARQNAFCKQKSRDCSEESTSAPPASPTEPDKKKFKPDPEEMSTESWVGVAGAGAGAGGWSAQAGWPLEAWCGALRAQLFSAQWEARHGAATALRELLRSDVVDNAGARAGMTTDEIETAHQEWLEDMCLRLLCVLALDRFGDFVSDQVVAPVRETAAQTLGVALARARGGGGDVARGVARLLAALARRPHWEARHGALLGCKYLCHARQDIARECGAIERLIEGLSDSAEDVSAVAAAALAPAAATLVSSHASLVPEIVSRLWNLLAEQDELAAPANSYMALLASLMSLPEAAKMLYPIDLADVLPRLWGYAHHCSSSVRKATMQTLATVTKPHEQDAEATVNWTPQLLQEAMRYVYQQILFEHVPEIQEVAMQVWRNLVSHSGLETLLVASCPLLAAWLCAAMTPPRLAADTHLLLPEPARQTRPRNGLISDVPPPECLMRPKRYLGGGDAAAANRDHVAMRARIRAAQCLGLLSCYLVQPAPGIVYKEEDESPIDCYVRVMTAYLRSGSALQRLVSSLVISFWAINTKETGLAPPPRVLLTNGDVPTTNGNAEAGPANGEIVKCDESGNGKIDLSAIAPAALTQCLHSALTQPLYYDEVALNCNRILQEARDLHAMMKHYKLPVDTEEFNNILRLEQVVQLATITEPMISRLKSKRVAGTLEERRKSLLSTAQQCSVEQTAYHVSVQAALAGACANLHSLPEKLNPVIRPLMESIKREPISELQKLSAEYLAVTLAQLSDRQSAPNNKVLCNLKHFLRCDPEITPRVNLSLTTDENSGDGSESPGEGRDPPDSHPHLDQKIGILTLWEQQRAAEKVTPRRGRPPAVASVSMDINVEQLASNADDKQKQLQVQRRGATYAFTSLAEYFGAELPEKLPKMWEFINEPFTKIMTDEELATQDVQATEELISRLQVIESVCSSLHESLRDKLDCTQLLRVCRHWSTAARHMAARALAALPNSAPSLIQLVTWLGDMRSARARCGAAEALARIADAARVHIVPYGALLVLPLLGRMSDPCVPVRAMSSQCFATLIQLMPLDGAVPEPPGLTPELRAKRDRDKKFLERLFYPKSIEDYKVPVPVNAQLRSYQQAGINWLRFLNEYKLHGVLCDDMGLGKTLQCICVVAGSHYERQKKFQETGADDCASLPSLVVCPPTLTGHWIFEVNKFIPSKYLKPLQYVGPPAERERLRLQVPQHDFIVASYDIVRKDIDFFSNMKWNYCILDEGHVIKNGKTKVFKAIKQLIANHRLILSGTPIQNNVLELWSLFEFLMPGLLGSERQFTARYSRPMACARAAPPAATAAATNAPQLLRAARDHHLACLTLHRQVLPFLLRRVKEDVLKELPPKITQDYFCELSQLQKQLYEDFSREHLPDGIGAHQHVFQALHYLQDVCNHPKLVLTGRHPAAARVAASLSAHGSTLDDINHAAKLPALKQLLLDCGIGNASADLESESVVSQHRALIFCQQKKMLDIVERDLLQRHLPSVAYLRLDGSVPAAARHSIVTTFNNDVSIDVLLLTTKVGGLGLNLTGADTVIFVEHDWNPTRDLQAMDRAHRIGQRRVVNVYRLITRNTLEERIMGLQKFKIQTANSVISQENAALETMGTESLLDLLQPQNKDGGNATNSSGRNVLDTLPELWDDRQYEEEYDITSFINSLNKNND